MHVNHIQLKWFDPPSAKDGPLGPNARKVGGWHYGIWNGNGTRIMGGTNGPDLDAAKARVIALAKDKGILDPTVTVIH